MSTHFADDSETRGFAEWLTNKLGKVKELSGYFPLTPENFAEKMSDGIILCKHVETINSSVIDMRAVNTGNLLIYHIHENLQLAISASQSLGCCTVNIGPVDIQEKKEHILKGLVWQQIRIDLLQSINLKNHPNILVLMREDETIEDFKRLTPEEILIRWVNYHLAKSESPHLHLSKINSDLKDSEIYSVLLHQITLNTPSPASLIDLSVSDREARATAMLTQADNIGCAFFIRPRDVVSGHYRLNLAFIANLFNTFPALEDMEYEEVEETREEKTLRTWLNSLGVNPFVKDLKFDLSDGLIYNQMLSILKPGCISEKEVIAEVTGIRGKFNKISNCSTAIKHAKSDFGFSLINIDGTNLAESNLMFILSLLSQSMRYDFIKMLMEISPNKTFADSDILDWANSKLPSPVGGFKDEAFSDSSPIFALIDAVKPNMYNKAHVNSGLSDDDKYSNAKLALSIVRKMGGKVFALPEDVIEHKARPIMLLCASLMIIDCRN